MRRKVNIIYITICFAVCLIPFCGMMVARTDSTTENRKMAEFPETTKDGKRNMEYLPELGAWFEDHFAFRPQMVMADSIIQSKVFRVSNMDSVIVGKDGWLYYTSTLSDYLGDDVISDVEAENAVHNISLMQKSVEDKGGTFLLTIAPNKNSLYGEHMPYYYSNIIESTHNTDIIVPGINERGIAYADLFRAFEQEEETLYLKRDSHWNGKGAVLAYNTIMNALMLDHETYETVPIVRKKDEYGDLNTMIYPLPFEPEWNYQYEGTDNYSYVTDTSSVEDAFIETINESGDGTLLMFRDSFGNTLLPLMASSFKNAWFSKAVPYNLGDYVNQYHPEYVVVEKVERNILDFAKDPAIITGPEVDISPYISLIQHNEDHAENVNIGECEYNTNYWQLSGEIETHNAGKERVYVLITTSDGKQRAYEAYMINKANTDIEYLLYIEKDNIINGNTDIDVLLDRDGSISQIAHSKFDPSMPVK